MGTVSRKVLILLVILVALTLFSSGYLLGSRSKSAASSPASTPPSSSNSSAWPASIVKKQQAVLEGTIVRSDKNTVTLKGSDNKEFTAKFAPFVTIYPLATASGVPVKATNDKSYLKTNQQVIMNLEPEGQEYLIKSISFTK